MIDEKLVAEFASMRQTIANFVQVLKQQDERITSLENQVKELTSSEEQTLLERFTMSSITNRNLNETPEVIAYAAHLFHVKQVPAMRISECGLLSQSKMHGLSRWDGQHLLDYLEINNVSDIYQNGVPATRAKELVPEYEKLQAYLDRTK